MINPKVLQDAVERSLGWNGAPKTIGLRREGLIQEVGRFLEARRESLAGVSEAAVNALCGRYL